MSVLTHCDGPGCEESVLTQDAHLTATGWNGRYLHGWLGMQTGDLHFDFHHIDCLTAWAAHPERAKT